MGIPASQSLVGNTTALAREAQDWLVELVKINTTNPPGNEQAAAKYIAGILTKEGITPEILDVAPGRSALVARLRSSAVADPSKALLLVAHMDVVGVDTSKWTVDPFGGVIKDGYLYGRGSIDDKGMLVANLAAFIALKRGNAHLNRDVIFLATTDEEQFGEASLKMLIAKYWDKFAAGFAINEGGKVVVKNGKVQYVAVQAAEKVPVNVSVVIAKGPSGQRRFQRKTTGGASGGGRGKNRCVHRAGASHVDHAAILRRTSGDRRRRNREMDAGDRYAGPRRARAASAVRRKSNVEFDDARYRRAHDAAGRRTRERDSFRGTGRAEHPTAAGRHRGRVAWGTEEAGERSGGDAGSQPDAGLAAPNSSLETEFYATMIKVSAQEFGGAPVLPFMSTGATDSAQLRLHSVQAYGLRPFPMTEEDDRRVHGDDERLPLAAFAKGVDLMTRIVAEFSVTK